IFIPPLRTKMSFTRVWVPNSRFLRKAFPLLTTEFPRCFPCMEFLLPSDFTPLPHVCLNVVSTTRKRQTALSRYVVCHVPLVLGFTAHFGSTREWKSLVGPQKRPEVDPNGIRQTGKNKAGRLQQSIPYR